MKKLLLVICIATVILLLLNEYDNSQHVNYSFYPNQDIINVYNEGWKDEIFEVGNFDFENTFLYMSKIHHPPRYHSILKGYDDGNYILETNDFDNDRTNVIANSEFEFYSDSGIAWFFYDGKKSNKQYSFFAAIVDNKKVKKPFRINIYDDNKYVFGFVRHYKRG